MKKIKYLSLIMIIVLALTGCGKETTSNNIETPSNNQQEEQPNNQDNKQVDEESPLKKMREKFENNDFSDIAGTYELVEFNEKTMYAQKYDNFHIKKLVIDKDGNIYKGEPYSGNTHFPIIEIREDTNWNYIMLEDSNFDMIFIYPIGFESRDTDYAPNSWNDKSKNRLSADFLGDDVRGLYYIQVD